VASVDSLGTRVRRKLARGRLDQRIAALEAEVQECRQVNLRLAELVDVVTELLLPVAAQDKERIEETLERYRKSVGGPTG
jgi:hypothetical protein